MSQRRRHTAKGASVSRTGKGGTTVQTHKATGVKPTGRRVNRVSRTTERVGREIIADRRDVLRELADR